MKKVLLILCLLTCVACVAACGEETPAGDTTCTVTWKNHDGTVLETDTNVEKGSVPEYNGDTPVKAGTAEYAYEFDGWTPEVGAVQGDTVYTAKFRTSTNAYTVTWMDGETVIETVKVTANTVPKKSYDRPDTVEWNYTFTGWAAEADGEALAELPIVTGNVTYYAVIKSEKRKYTVTFGTNGGSAVAPVTAEYGSEIAEPAKPEQEGMRFVGWCTDAGLNNPVSWPLTLTGNVTLYASWNVKVDFSRYLSALLSGFELDPYSYIPDTMKADYSRNLVDGSAIPADYLGFVNVSDIPAAGFGEQWYMVLENLSQSELFFEALSVVEGLTTTSVAAFNNYLDSNPGDTAHHSFASGIYSVTIDFDGRTMTYVLDYTATFPAVGEQTAQIALSMDIETNEKTVRVQLGNPNALTYTISENSYCFAIKYLGVRRASFDIERNADGSVEGHIYEFLTVKGVGYKSAADFYIDDDYVSVVGNKADGITGFTGYISELYDAKTGRMLGYEVREELSSIVYNTLWLDFGYLTGINSIKYVPATEEDSAYFCVNGSSTAWKSKKVGGFGAKMLSRRFDIEFRTRYYFSYDAVNEKYVAYKASVPMLFVQEEFYDSLVSDVRSTNSVTLSVRLSSSHLAKLQADYDRLVDVFAAHKEAITEETIISAIGEAVTFAN